MSRLKSLLRVSDPSPRNTQQIPVQVCMAEAQHTHTTQQGLLHVAHPSPCNTQQDSSEVFQFTPPGDPGNDDEALRERVAIMVIENDWNEATALQEARWQADRERGWLAFLRNAERILAVPGAKHGAMISIYQAEAIRRYGERTGTDMALSLASWVRARGVH